MSELTINPVDVAKLTVEPGELVLVQVDGVIDMETAKRIKAAFLRAFVESGGDVPSILVIDKQTKVSVMRVADLGQRGAFMKITMTAAAPGDGVRRP